MEEIEKILKEEVKRLQRVNIEMENSIDKTTIKDNALAMCEITKTLQIINGLNLAQQLYGK